MAVGLSRVTVLLRPAWRRMLLAGVTASVVFVLTDNRWVQGSLWVGMYATSTVFLARAWRAGQRHPPDRLVGVLLTGAVLYLLADIGWSFWPLVTGRPLQTPSLVDGLYFASYGCFTVFLLMLGRRYRSLDRRGTFDGLIVGLGLTPLGWVTLVEPALASGLSNTEATYLAYPLAVSVLFPLAVRIAFVANRRSVPYLLLGGWLGLELVADTAYAVSGVTDTFDYGEPWQILWILSSACLGALALHPDVGQVGDPSAARVVSARARLLLLGGALGLPGLVIAYEARAFGDRVVLFSAGVSLLLIVLVCLRLSGLMVDLAAQRQVQAAPEQLTEDLTHLSLHDPLTGLGNRALFRTQTEFALSQRATDADRAAIVVLLDLDDFKTINDTLGHDAGDRVLVEVGRRLEQVTRRGETITRLGGDEFAIVMVQAHLADALRLADRIERALDVPLPLGNRTVRPRASIGISAALRGQDRSTLLAEADIALYAAKRRAGHTPAVFDPELHREVLDQHELENDLHEAIDRGELHLLYQPLVDLASNDMVGVEALLRWQHPTRGLISPVRFIPLAEANGAILQIGDWVLQQACRQLLAWDDQHPALRLHMSVNVSPRQLADPDFVQRAATTLQGSSLDPARVTLEITEAALGSDTETMIVRLQQLKELGVTLAIDDFGTGYSSLSHLRRLPVDILKIDKSFVTGVAREAAEWALTTAIVRLATSLGKTTLAEGIETGGQLAHLRSLNCQLGQGYLFSPPVPPATISQLTHAPAGQTFTFD